LNRLSRLVRLHEVGTHRDHNLNRALRHRIGVIAMQEQNRRTGAAAVHKCLPVFRTQKRNARFSACNSASSEPRSCVDTRLETEGMEAFEGMVVASRSKFLTIANAILRNREDAEDAVQNAILSGYRHLPSFGGRSDLTTWFTRIVMNAALMIRRKQKSVLDEAPTRDLHLGRC
jgi:hypothetical protein